MADFADFRGDTKDAGRALAAVTRDAEGNASDVVLEVVKDIYKAAKLNESRVPKSAATYPRSPSVIVLKPTQEGGTIRAEGAPWARGAEYGAETFKVFGRGTLQRLMRRRTMQPWRRGAFDGYMIGKAWRDAARSAGDKAADAMLGEMSTEFDKAGLPKGRG